MAMYLMVNDKCKKQRHTICYYQVVMCADHSFMDRQQDNPQASGQGHKNLRSD